MRKIQGKEELWVILFIIILFGLAIVPLIHWVIRAPVGTVFPLIHNYSFDYFYYLHVMKQGLDGRWLTMSRFTPENFPPQLGMTFFIILGKLSWIFKGDLPFTYTFARIMLGVILYLTIYKLISLVYREDKSKRLIAFFFVCFSSTFWFIKNDPAGKLFIENAFGNWTEFDTLHRAIFLPHHLLSYLSLIMVLIFLVRSFRSPGIFNPILFILFTVVCGLTNPGTFLILGMVIGLFVLGELLINWRHLIFVWERIGVKISVFWIFYLLIIFYLYTLQNTNFPWTAMRDQERYWRLNISLSDYIRGLGPLVFPAAIGSIVVFCRKNISQIEKLILYWFISPFLGLFVLDKFIPVANQRLLQSAHFIPIAILSVEGLIAMARKTEDWLKRFFHQSPRQRIILSLFIFVLAVYSSVSIYGSLAHDWDVFPTNVYNYYVPSEVITAIGWLDKNTPADSVVLAQGYMGNFIPAYVHNRVVAGHQNLTYNYPEKSQEAGLFFAQNNLVRAREILSKYQVSYVFFSLDTPPVNEEFIKQLNLRIVFSNQKVSIYQVK